jgi:hypothetical protein
VGGSTRRARRVLAIVSAVSGSEPLHFRVDIERVSTPVSGHVQLDGMASRSFTGWTELFAVFEQAIADAAGTRASAGPDDLPKPVTPIAEAEEKSQ